MMELHIRDLSKTHSNGALKDVTLTIPAGMYGLLGPNGSGGVHVDAHDCHPAEPDESRIRLRDTGVLNVAGRDRRRSV